MTNLPEKSHQSEIILYQTDDGKTKIQVRVEGETVWLSLNQMAELFQRDNYVISRHIRNFFEESEPFSSVFATWANVGGLVSGESGNETGWLRKCP